MSTRNVWIFLPALLLTFAMIGLPRAHADDYNQLSYLTFNEPIRISSPNGPVDLAPGTYEFKLLDSSDRNIVEVFDANHNPITMAYTISTEYVAPTTRDLVDHTMLTFAEGSKNQPLTLVKWYYPDNPFGHEFVYSNRIEGQLSEEPMITVKAVHTKQALGGPVSASFNMKSASANRS